MDLPEKQGEYNLLEEKWIPILYGNGRTDRIGIRQALTEAQSIRQLAASNPMDRVALLRFLLAVLLWCKGDAKSCLAALDQKNAGIPEDWLAKLEEHKTVFNLLGDGRRFFQDDSLKDTKSRPIGDLLVEFPGEDSVNHMRHIVHDGSYGFCPACCAMGILRLSVWAPANRYYPASVNPGSAAYTIIEGKDLSQTLCANLPELIPQAVQAPWLSNDLPNSPDAVARLAWRPRKLWLNVGNENGLCSNCGSFDELITSLCNEGGWPTPTSEGQKKKFWDTDPHLLKKEKEKDGEPLSLPSLGGDVAEHSSKFWRDALRLQQERIGRVTAIGPVVNKFTFQDCVSVALPDVSTSINIRAKFSADCSNDLSGLLKKTTWNPKRQHPEIITAVKLLTPNAETQIRNRLNRLNSAADNNPAVNKAFLREVYKPVVEQVIASVTPGSPLRRQSTRNYAQALLNKKINELVEKSDQPTITETNATVTDKPKRGRKKGGPQ